MQRSNFTESLSAKWQRNNLTEFWLEKRNFSWKRSKIATNNKISIKDVYKAYGGRITIMVPRQIFQTFQVLTFTFCVNIKEKFGSNFRLI